MRYSFVVMVDAPAPGNLATAPYYFSELSRFLDQGWPPLPPRPPPPPPPPPPARLNVTVELVVSKGRFDNNTAAARESDRAFVLSVLMQVLIPNDSYGLQWHALHRPPCATKLTCSITLATKAAVASRDGAQISWDIGRRGPSKAAGTKASMDGAWPRKGQSGHSVARLCRRQRLKEERK